MKKMKAFFHQHMHKTRRKNWKYVKTMRSAIAAEETTWKTARLLHNSSRFCICICDRRAFILCTRKLENNFWCGSKQQAAMVMSLFYYYFIVILLCTEIHFVCFGDGFFPRRMACTFFTTFLSFFHLQLRIAFFGDTEGRDSNCYSTLLFFGAHKIK